MSEERKGAVHITKRIPTSLLLLALHCLLSDRLNLHASLSALRILLVHLLQYCATHAQALNTLNCRRRKPLHTTLLLLQQRLGLTLPPLAKSHGSSSKPTC